jgi:O-antigen ligase
LSPGRRVPLILNNFHRLFVDRDLIYNRVSGFAYEPSWLGNQLMVLYFPLWAASLILGYSAFPRLWKKVGLEGIFLAWGIVVLFLTQSRNSYLTLLFWVFLGMLYLGWQFSARLARIRIRGEELSAWQTITRQILLFGTIIIFFVLFLSGLAWGVSKIDRRMTRLLEVPGRLQEIKALYPNEGVYEAANRLAFAERLVYWEAAYRVFERYPILGVGLGGSGFLFPEVVPKYGYSLLEIQDTLSLENLNLPNPKNLWLRILSETGIIGASVFLVWYVVLGATAVQRVKSGSILGRVVGVMGILYLLAQIIEGFSMDTFALPYLWISSGLILWRAGSYSGQGSNVVTESVPDPLMMDDEEAGSSSHND